MKTPLQQAEDLFHRALDLPATERAAFLTDACTGQAGLHAQVEALLQAHERGGGFLPTEAGGPVAISITPESAAVEAGAVIGRYKLLQKIGEGGCGVVFMAEQAEPVRRRVALKIIKLGMDTRQVIARFEAERQALAMMDHPNIAKVLDGGATENGRPYFVMELVRGVRITDYCDQACLTTVQRIDLFIQVCQAVQHAHQKGIIHRDLKPSNILVTVNDGIAVPKVIDFGIAKATAGQPLTDKTIFTAFEQFIGTPAYMSPEQALMTSLDIDTRSDIYALGVLLYELLTGRTPFDARALLTAGLDDLRRTILETDPARPSARLSSLAQGELTTAAKRRATVAPKLIHSMQGDLDWIVMKCLEKNRSRRYETANGLAADLQRHLANEPVVARPPSAAYRLQKAVHRNKAAFTAVSAIAFSLVLGLGLAIWQAICAQAAQREQTHLRLQAEASERAAKTEALRSERVSQFFQDMLKGIGPSVARGRDTALIREILDKTAQSLGADLQEEPSVEAQLRNTLGEIYRQLGDLPRAEAMIREALVLRPRLNNGEHKEVARSLEALGLIHHDRNEHAQAEAAHIEALALKRRLFGESDKAIASSLNNLGAVLLRRGDLAEAEASFRKAMEIARRIQGEEGFVAMTLANLGVIYGMRGEYAEAEKLFRQDLEISRREKGNEHPDVANSLEQLANNFADQGRLDEAERLHRDALAIYRKVMGENHPEMVRSLQNLAHTLRLQGDIAGEEAACREALAICRHQPGNDDKLASALYILSTVLLRRRQFAESESLLRESLGIRERFHGRESREVAEALSNLGIVVSETGDHLQAERYLRECVGIRQKIYGPYHPDVAGALSNLGWSLVNQHLWSEAESTFRAALDTLDRSPSAKPEDRKAPLANLIFVLSQHGKFEALEVFLERGLQAATDPSVKVLYIGARASLHARTGRWQEATADYARAIELQSDNHEHYHELAPLLVSNGDLDGYRKLCAKEIERFHNTKDAHVAERMAKDCLILPNSGADLQVVAAWAELAVTVGQKSDDLPRFQHAKGLSEYRQGHFAEAIEWAQKALSRSSVERRDPQATAVLAMAQQQGGQQDAARASLARAVELEAELPKLESRDIGADWPDWIITHLLIREARNLIEGGPVPDLRKPFPPREASP